jgi:hypothetical protein
MVVSMFFGKKNGDYCENKSCTGIDWSCFVICLCGHH